MAGAVKAGFAVNVHAWTRAGLPSHGRMHGGAALPGRGWRRLGRCTCGHFGPWSNLQHAGRAANPAAAGSGILIYTTPGTIRPKKKLKQTDGPGSD